MTDYNDGKWHGWNGGDWPEGVHKKSMVEAYYRIESYTDGFTIQGALEARTAYGRSWPDIVAFRVVKPYREPRVWWLVIDKWGDVFAAHTSLDVAKENGRYATEPTFVRAVEQPE